MRAGASRNQFSVYLVSSVVSQLVCCIFVVDGAGRVREREGERRPGKAASRLWHATFAEERVRERAPCLCVGAGRGVAEDDVPTGW